MSFKTKLRISLSYIKFESISLIINRTESIVILNKIIIWLKIIIKRLDFRIENRYLSIYTSMRLHHARNPFYFPFDRKREYWKCVGGQANKGGFFIDDDNDIYITLRDLSSTLFFSFELFKLVCCLWMLDSSVCIPCVHTKIWTSTYSINITIFHTVDEYE